MKRSIFLLLFLSLHAFAFSQSQDTIKIVSYNLLNYPASGTAMSADTSTRNPYFRTVLNAINPDILVVQELTSLNGITGFLDNVLNANSVSYSMGPFHNGYDTDNGIFFKSSKFHSCTNKVIDTELRDIDEYKMVHTLSGDTIRIYSLHLKASTGSSNEAQRAREVDSLRKVTNALPLGTDFIVCGDFNIYSSTESAYQKLKQVIGGNQGHVIDPINMTGSFGQSIYAIHHTQSPRIRSFGGGATGGLDDRFDMILYSLAVSQAGGIRYVSNSTTAFGNDGTLYNDSVNHPSNSAVSPTIANALHNASDHLPAIAKFTFEYTAGATPTDFGVTALTEPEHPMCGNAAQNIAVTVKNFGALPVDFSTDVLEVHVLVSTPSLVTHHFSETINSGTLAAGAIMQVNFSSLIDMSGPGTYTFKCYTVHANDANALNDTLALASVNVTTATAEISPVGPNSICAGDSILLSANTGSSYLWSTGATTQSIYAVDSGSYTVQVTISGGCATISSPVSVSYFTPATGGFYESIGSVAATTAISTHESNNGFDNDSFTMSGTADIRNTLPSSGYTSASGAANIFFTSNNTRTFSIAGINTSGLSNIQLSHGIYKSTIASNGSAMVVEVSSDGIDFTPLTAAALPTGSGTAIWHYRSMSGTIPAVPNLTIRFSATTTTESYRIDDITLSGDPVSPSITASGSTSLCLGDSLELTASTGNIYRWNTGQTSQSIIVKSSGDYSVRVDCAESDTLSVSVNNCTDVTLQLKAFIQGFYIGNQSMNAVADPVNHPGICDTITVSLADAQSPHNIQHSITSVLSTDGTGSFVFPSSVFNDSFYLVVNHRNSLETWSSETILFNDTIMVYDFTTSAGNAYGNNLANMDGEFCIYSGDITDGISTGTQDGMIDILDYNFLENSLMQFLTGYHVYDLTGDGIVESADFSLIETNSVPPIQLMRP